MMPAAGGVVGTRMGEREDWQAAGGEGLLEHDDTLNKFFDVNPKKVRQRTFAFGYFEKRTVYTLETRY